MTTKPKETYHRTDDGKFKILRETEVVLEPDQLLALREQHNHQLERMKQNLEQKTKEIEQHQKNLDHLDNLIKTAKDLGIDFTKAEENLRKVKESMKKE